MIKEQRVGSDPDGVLARDELFQHLPPALQEFAIIVGQNRPIGSFTLDWISIFIKSEDIHSRQVWRNFRNLIAFGLVIKGEDGGFHLYDEDLPERLIPDTLPPTTQPDSTARKYRFSDNFGRFPKK